VRQLDLTGDAKETSGGQVSHCYRTAEGPFPRTLRSETVANDYIGKRPRTRQQERIVPLMSTRASITTALKPMACVNARARRHFKRLLLC
jgi:hypothetical protein